MDKVENGSKDIVNSFKKTVISDELGKISENVSETIIDSILDEGLMKEVPLIGTAIGLFKVGKTITARQHVKKLWRFLFHLNQVPQADRQKFSEKVEADGKTRDELFERTLFIIERLDDEKKADIIGRLFTNLVLEKIKTTDYLRLSVIVDKTYLTDLIYLHMSYNRDRIFSLEERQKFYTENDTKFLTENLVTAGLLRKETVEDRIRPIVMGDREKTYATRIDLTDIGGTLIKFGF